MAQDNLNSRDIDILVDSLEAWEQKDQAGEMMFGLMDALLFKDAPEEAKGELERAKEERRIQAERDKRERKETSLLLKAKLIMIKQSLVIDEANKIIAV